MNSKKIESLGPLDSKMLMANAQRYEEAKEEAIKLSQKAVKEKMEKLEAEKAKGILPKSVQEVAEEFAKLVLSNTGAKEASRLDAPKDLSKVKFVTLEQSIQIMRKSNDNF